MKNPIPWPNKLAQALPIPARIMRPCDYGLLLAVGSLETQLGTIEAYNRLVESAEQLKQKIDDGEAIPANCIYAASVGAMSK